VEPGSAAGIGGEGDEHRFESRLRGGVGADRS
jgi:hypothetical protein